jgi:hypothetical protein
VQVRADAQLLAAGDLEDFALQAAPLGDVGDDREPVRGAVQVRERRDAGGSKVEPSRRRHLNSTASARVSPVDLTSVGRQVAARTRRLRDQVVDRGVDARCPARSRTCVRTPGWPCGSCCRNR